MGHHNIMMMNNLTELQDSARKPSYLGKSQKDVPPSKFKASEPMVVPCSNSRTYQFSSSMSLIGASSINDLEQEYDLLTWQMYFRIMSARSRAGEAEQRAPEHVFSRVDVNEPRDQTTTPIAFQAIPSKSRNKINHSRTQYIHVPPPLVSDTTSVEDFLGDRYHEGEVFTLDI
jgi:hypothetical protein